MSGVHAGAWVVVAGSAAVGALHALLPDHWIPFVLLSKARGWDLGRSLAAVAAGGVAHLASTTALGLVMAFLGAEAISRYGVAAEVAGAAILAVFGFALSLRALAAARKGAGHGPSHDHGHSHARAAPDHDHHAHGRSHILEGAVLGVRPCAEAIPVFLASAAYGLASSLFTVLAWVVATLGVMLAVVWLSLVGLRSFKPEFLERYGELAAGLVILVMGLGAAVLAFRM